MNFQNLFDLEDKVVFITGGGRGIGQSMAKGFSALGAKISICDQNQEGIEETKSIIMNESSSKVALVSSVVDVRNKKDLEEAINLTELNLNYLKDLY